MNSDICFLLVSVRCRCVAEGRWKPVSIGRYSLGCWLIGRCDPVGEGCQSLGETRSDGADPADSVLVDEVTNLPMMGGLVPQLVDPARPWCHRDVGVFPVHLSLLLIGIGPERHGEQVAFYLRP